MQKIFLFAQKKRGAILKKSILWKSFINGMLMIPIITMNRRTAYMYNILNHLFQPPGPLPYFYCFSSNLHLASWQAENIRTTTRKFLLHIGGSLLCHGEHEFYFNTSTILQTVELIIFRRRVYNVPAHDIAGLISEPFFVWWTWRFYAFDAL